MSTRIITCILMALIAAALGILCVRLWKRYNMTSTPPRKSIPTDDEGKANLEIIWQKITTILEDKEEWRNPYLTLTSLTGKIYSNRTYVSDAFKHFTGMTFKEYIIRRRISYVIEELRRNHEADLQKVFSNAGYHDRTTAWRHFQKITGVSPTEFIRSLR